MQTLKLEIEHAWSSRSNKVVDEVSKKYGRSNKYENITYVSILSRWPLILLSAFATSVMFRWRPRRIRDSKISWLEAKILRRRKTLLLKCITTDAGTVTCSLLIKWKYLSTRFNPFLFRELKSKAKNAFAKYVQLNVDATDFSFQNKY